MDRYSLLIINGPNLNPVSPNELRAFSTNWLDDVEELCREQAIDLDVSIDFRHSNHEGEIVEWIYEGARAFDGVIINSSSYCYTSWAIHDALSNISIPTIEVKLSNESKYCKEKRDITTRAVDIIIAGADDYGYLLAMDAMIQILDKDKKE